MELFQKVQELDIAYLDTFTNRLNKDWGYIFYNQDQPNYYDANHAHLNEGQLEFDRIIHEVLDFYQSHNIIPRFYLHNSEKQARFLEKLTSCNFQYEELTSPIQIWNQSQSIHNQSENVTIEQVTTKNLNDAIFVECSITELGGKIREKAFLQEFNHPSFTHYLLRYKGTPCSTACLFEYKDQIRMESVATIKEFRGKGLIGELIYFLQSEVTKRGIKDFWVFPINERVEKVYTKYGFKTIGKYTMIHAFLGGRSIKEIHNG